MYDVQLIIFIIGFEDMLWQVPVTIATSQQKEAYKFVLDKQSTTITLEGLKPDDWIKVNTFYQHQLHIMYISLILVKLDFIVSTILLKLLLHC